MLILTNFKCFPAEWSVLGVSGQTREIQASAWDFFVNSFRADLIVINCDLNLTVNLALLFCFLPFLKKPIIAVDLVLRQPVTAKQRVLTALRRIFLKRVDHFIHYFRDLEAYERVFGVSNAKSSYVLFKANIWDQVDREQSFDRDSKEGPYILAAGKSLRDFDTFLEAIDGLPYPAAIFEPDAVELARHGAKLTRDRSQFPKNLALLSDKKGAASWLENLKQAKILVIPVLRSSLCASGISTYLDGMLLGKCVVISEGPGASDVLTKDQAAVVPAENANALREKLKLLCEDEALRRHLAKNGRELALQAGGERELFKRVLERSVEWTLAQRSSQTIGRGK